MSDDVFRIYDPGYDEFARDGYPKIWHATIKHAVREQAGHRCVRCGHPYRNGEHGSGQWSPCDFDTCEHPGPLRVRGDQDEAWTLSPLATTRDHEVWVEDGWDDVEAEWRILTVHHLNGAKADCRWWNLAALCQRCHLTIQGKVVMSRTYDREHTEWFKPYVAGFYAFTNLGEDLTRPEVEARLDELLALELRQERLPMSVVESKGDR